MAAHNPRPSAYAEHMPLPSPALQMTPAELDADPQRAIDVLKSGGAILLFSNDGDRFFGVLTRDPEILGDAELAQAVQAGRIPPLSDLLAQ